MTCGLLTSPNSGQKQKLEALWQGATKTTVCAVFLNIRQMTKSLPKANCVKHAEPGALDVHPKTPKGHKATPRLLGHSAWTFTFRFHSRWYNGHRHTSSLNFDWGRFTKRSFQLMNHFQVYALVQTTSTHIHLECEGLWKGRLKSLHTYNMSTGWIEKPIVRTLMGKSQLAARQQSGFSVRAKPSNLSNTKKSSCRLQGR